jgi:hypothetical protein
MAEEVIPFELATILTSVNLDTDVALEAKQTRF